MTEDRYSEVVAAMDGAMVVVTTASRGGVDGCLVGFHSQCSIDPLRHAVWLSVANRTYELALDASHLAVHLLGADDHALAEHFGGQTGDEVDKLGSVSWTEGPGGVPLIDSLGARFVGRIVEQLGGGGDHHLFVVEPERVDGTAPEAPLRLSEADDIEPGHAAEDRR